MDLVLQFFLAVLPIILIFAGLICLKQSGTTMGILGWFLTVVIAVLFFQTSLKVALAASWAGSPLSRIPPCTGPVSSMK